MKHHKTTQSILAALAMLMLAVLTAGQSAAETDDWEFDLSLYALFPNISGDASLGRIGGADVDVDTGDVLDVLELGGMIHTEARHSSGFGMILAYAFMDVGDKATGPLEFASFKADAFQGILEAYGMYRYAYDGGTIDAVAGVRWWDIDIDIKATLEGTTRSFGQDADWVDPVVGVRWIPRLADDWRLYVLGDVGGFGISSDFTWNVIAGVGWDAWEKATIFLMYRLLAVDYETGTPGTPDYFAYDTLTQGPMLGVTFRF